jgi:non-ribosomal peptide synthase protein (TIGR01720 family)
VDLSRNPNGSRALAAHAAQSQSRFDLGRAPLWSAVLYEVPDGQRLLLTAHHLIIDGVSWRILLEHLEHLLDQRQTGQALTLPARSTAYPAWVDSQRAAVRTSLQAERGYWSSPGLRVGGVLPVGRQAVLQDTHAGRRAIHSSLPKELTRSLSTEAHNAYSTEINDLLIAAVVRAWRAWTGSRCCALTLEGHGREPLEPGIDVSQTIGWFTSIFPVAFEFPDGATPGDAIKAVKETLRAIPRKGAGYSILRYLSEDDVSSLAELPPVAFNYLGSFDSTDGAWFERAPEPAPPTAASTLPMPWPLEITAAIVEEKMELTLAYSVERFDKAGVQPFFEGIRAEIEAIVDHTLGRETTELTASDVDYDGFTQDGLAAFLNTL